MRKPVHREFGLVLGHDQVISNDQVRHDFALALELAEFGREALAFIQCGLGLVTDCDRSVRAVPRVLLVVPIWLRIARGLRRPCIYERTCVCICACECGTHVYSTRTGPGNERTGLFVCAYECVTHVYFTHTGPGHGCVLPTGRGARPKFILGLCVTFPRVYVRYCFRLGQCEQCISYMCVCVCTAVVMCSPSVVPLAVSTCMRVLYSIWHGGLGAVRSIHKCYLHECTVRVPLEQCLAWLARAM